MTPYIEIVKESPTPVSKLGDIATSMSFFASGGAGTGTHGIGAHYSGQKSFHVAGIVDPAKHYIIDRSAWHEMLASKLANGMFVLLQAHRQAGKSSAASAVVILS